MLQNNQVQRSAGGGFDIHLLFVVLESLFKTELDLFYHLRVLAKVICVILNESHCTNSIKTSTWIVKISRCVVLVPIL